MGMKRKQHWRGKPVKEEPGELDGSSEETQDKGEIPLLLWSQKHDGRAFGVEIRSGSFCLSGRQTLLQIDGRQLAAANSRAGFLALGSGPLPTDRLYVSTDRIVFFATICSGDVLRSCVKPSRKRQCIFVAKKTILSVETYNPIHTQSFE